LIRHKHPAAFRGDRERCDSLRLRVEPGCGLAGLGDGAQYRVLRADEAAAAERAVMAQLRLALDIHRREYFDDDEPRLAAE
jgi:hypothetical protein